MVLIVLAPIVLTLFAAFKTKGDMVKTSPLLLPPAARITLDNFKKVLGDKYLLIGFKNTGIILVVSIFFNVMFGTITACLLYTSTGPPDSGRDRSGWPMSGRSGLAIRPARRRLRRRERFRLTIS